MVAAGCSIVIFSFVAEMRFFQNTAAKLQDKASIKQAHGEPFSSTTDQRTLSEGGETEAATKITLSPCLIPKPWYGCFPAPFNPSLPERVSRKQAGRSHLEIRCTAETWFLCSACSIWYFSAKAGETGELLGRRAWKRVAELSSCF